MRVVWKPIKTKDKEFNAEFINVIEAEVKGITLDVWSVKHKKRSGFHVLWLVTMFSGELYAVGRFYCTKKQVKTAYKLAKKRAKMFAECWE